MSPSILGGCYLIEYSLPPNALLQSSSRSAMAVKATASSKQSVDNNIILVLLNFSAAFFFVITLFTKIHTDLPNILSTCIGPTSHKKAQSMHSCMRTHIDKKHNNTHHVANLSQCAIEGNIGGLIASICHWFRVEYSDANLFIFGFASSQDLQILAYEAFVSAVCWGVSYLWIRRGMNPETRNNYYSKYWKDAIYGSLAGFNATFMKGVLKHAIRNASK